MLAMIIDISHYSFGEKLRLGWRRGCRGLSRVWAVPLEIQGLPGENLSPPPSPSSESSVQPTQADSPPCSKLSRCERRTVPVPQGRGRRAWAWYFGEGQLTPSSPLPCLQSPSLAAWKAASCSAGFRSVATRLSLREVRVCSRTGAGSALRWITEQLCDAGRGPAPLCALLSPAELERVRQSVPTPRSSVSL